MRLKKEGLIMPTQLRASLQKAMDALKNEVVSMGDVVLNNISEAFDAFKRNDVELAKTVMKRDNEVDRLEEDIAKHALRIIWKEQPMAHDLRVVTGILKLISDLERIGDHACDISEIVTHIEHLYHPRMLPKTKKMSDAAYQMVLDAINAFVKQDHQLAKKIIQDDDVVDKLFNEVMSDITDQLKTDKIDSEYAVSVIMVAKYIERVADHAVNLAEWIIFMITGDHKETPLF